MTIARRTLLLGTTGLVASGCTAKPEQASTSAAEKTKPVKLMLNWYPYGEHAGFYYGLSQGIFKDHGIDLEIQAGQGSTKTVQAVGSGQVQFGWADTPALLANIDKGVKAKSIGVFLQTTPSSVQLFADSGIQSPLDLKGKTIAVSAGDAPTTMFPTYLERAGLASEDVQTQNLDATGKISAVLSNQVDGLIGFAHDQGPIIAERSGKEMVYLKYADVGLNYYSNGLITHPETIASDPDLVKAMVAATSEAFADAAENAEKAVDSMAGKDPQMPPPEVLENQWLETVKLLTTEITQGRPPGVNDAADWDATIQLLAEEGLISSAKPASTYFDSSFQPK